MDTDEPIQATVPQPDTPAAEDDIPLAAAAPPTPLGYDKAAGESPVAPFVLEGSVRRHVVLPLAIVCIGTAMLYGGLAWRVGFDFQGEFPRLATRHSADVILTLALQFAACVWFARHFDVTFGLLLPAVTKLAAVAIFPMGVASVLAAAIGGGGGALAVGWLMSIPVLWVVFAYLFDTMLPQEAVVCCCAFTTIRLFLLIAVQPF